MICIISCGSKKALTPKPAKYLYTGTHFKRCLMWAMANFSQDDIYILSAKYGLLKLDTIIEHYDLKMGQKGCVSIEKLKEQAFMFRIDHQKVISTCGERYREALDKVFYKPEYPFKGLSMGIS